MEPSQPNVGNRSLRVKVYFILSAISIAVLALVWSIDFSFVYILLGISIFFLTLGFLARPVVLHKDNILRKTSRDRVEFSFTAGIVKWIQTASRNGVRKKFIAEPQKFIRSIFSIILVFALIIVFVVFLNSNSERNAEDYYSSADSFYWSLNYDSAYINYKRAVNIKPEYIEAWNGLGNIKLSAGDNDSAYTSMIKR